MSSAPLSPKLASARRRAALCDPAALAGLFSPFLDPVVPSGAGARRRLFPALTTLWLFLYQCLSGFLSCREAVLRLSMQCAAAALPVPSPSTGAYCRARKRLPLPWLEGLESAAATAVVKGMPEQWLWHGHDVKVCDGTELLLADTPGNAAEWPQPKTQRPGCGFPVVRIVAVFSLAAGVVLARAAGSLAQGEATLFAGLLGAFSPGDVVLRDRAFSSYGITAALLSRGAHSVMRVHHR